MWDLGGETWRGVVLQLFTGLGVEATRMRMNGAKERELRPSSQHPKIIVSTSWGVETMVWWQLAR